MRLKGHGSLLAGAALLALMPMGRASICHAGLCDSCITVVDACCERLPSIVDPGYTPPARGVVETRAPNAAAGDFCVTLYDIARSVPAENVGWGPTTRYHGPADSWNLANLGTVFGLTLDRHGNLYVCHTSCYATDAVGPGGAGAIYRIDGTTGAISTFAILPNLLDPNLSAPDDRPGLGNISYDCDHDQFFATDLENGKIYRLKSANALNASPAAVLDFFDPLAPDDGLPGFAPLGERLWAVQWHADRVYYSVWAADFGSGLASNTIRSVALEAGGGFVWSSDRAEIVVPAYSAAGWSSGPVSDLGFGPSGSLLLAERAMSGPTTPIAHQARVLEYQCASPGGGWSVASSYAIGVSVQSEAAGGVDYDYAIYDGPSPSATAPPGLGGSQGRVWATADAIHSGAPYTDVIYGLQALRPSGGSVTTSLLLDSDANTATAEDTFLGDIEIGCPYEALGVGDLTSPESPGAVLAWVAPTPWRGSSALHFVTARSGPVTVSLFDVGGRAVRRLVTRRWLPAGHHEVALDGRDDRGNPLHSGVYLYRLSTPANVAAGRFVIVR